MEKIKGSKAYHERHILDRAAVKGWLEEAGELYLQRVRELSIIRRLTDSISLGLDADKACEFILDILLDELDVANASIMLYDESRDELVLKSARGQEDETAHSCPHLKPGHGFCMKKGEGIAGKVLQGGQPILVNDVNRSPSFLKDNKQTVTIGSMLSLPLILRGKTVGVLNLSHTQKNGFSQGAVHGLTIISNQIAMQLDNAEIYKRLLLVNSGLEEEVRKRTSHLEKANQELRRTRSRLVQSEKLKALGQMASGVAHDFNNTLAGIIGNTQLLLAQVDQHRLRERLEAIEMAARDGAITVRRIQEFSRVRKTREFTSVDVNGLVLDVIKITSPMWKDQLQKQGRTVELTTKFNVLQTVAGNAAELREVLTNIILNALDAMPNGGKITISTWADDRYGYIAIADTGQGMSVDVQQRIFDPFFSSKGPGNSGLGLSVAYGIIRRHDGKITVASAEGEGTSFTIQLPVCGGLAECRDEVVEQETPDLAAAEILLIDDDKTVRDVLSAILTEAGHQVVSVDSGAKGVETFDSGELDIVLTDLGMPGMSGWEVAAAIKRRDPAIPVVMVTGWGKQLDEEDIRKNGVDFLLFKPFELVKVQSTVAEALRSRGSS
jgi:signal transduction histidine kinase/ActR/RegA family two-component response regulator